MPAAVDISGERYGRLVAIEYAGYLRVGSQPKRAFRFRCDCGAVVVRTLMDVRRLDTMSCGCLKSDNLAKKPAHNRLSEGESSFRNLYYTYKRRAKAMGIEFDLSLDAFRNITKQDCSYCGAPPLQEKRAHRSSHGEYLYNGLDRVDNSAGYEPWNVVACCGVCNRAKGVMGRKDFIRLAKSIAVRCHAEA